MMLRSFLITLAALGGLISLSACAQMRVQVDVANGEEVRAAIASRASREQLLAYLIESEPDLRIRTAALKEEMDGLLGELADSYDRLAAIYADGSSERKDLEDLADYYRGESSIEIAFDNEVDLYFMNANAKNGQLRQRYNQLNASSRRAADRQLNQLLTERSQLDTALLNRLLATINGVKSTRDDQLRDARNAGVASLAPTATADRVDAAVSEAAADTEARFNQAASRVNRSIIGDGSLVGTGYSYAIAALDDNHWKPRYNEALGRGQFGNTNIVIRMNSVGNFSVKGLTFDASTVAAVASKVTIQSLLVGAQIAGVPVTNQPEGSTNHLVTAGSRLNEAELSQAERDALRRAREQALIELAFAVLNEDSQISRVSASGNPAHEPIDSVFKALNDLLMLEPVTD